MLTVRASTYRGKPGWLVCGSVAKDKPRVRVFTPYRLVAEHIREKLNAGRDINAIDFQPPEGK